MREIDDVINEYGGWPGASPELTAPGVGSGSAASPELAAPGHGGVDGEVDVTGEGGEDITKMPKVPERDAKRAESLFFPLLPAAFRPDERG